jgi:archaellum biogenesis ATPase FlaH
MNIEEIRKWWNVFVGDGNFTEIRILGKFSYSGYFRSVDRLIDAISPYEQLDDEQFYFVLNRIDDACYGRQQSEKIVKSPKITTNDNDIIRRQWVMVDFDPVRKSGTNSSEEEYQLAFSKARDVFYFLQGKGFAEPVIANSGNGVHLQYHVDLPNDEETTDIIKRFFQYLGSQFSDERVEVDLKNFNLARLCKMYGSVAKKGANLPARPWRESAIIYIPQTIQAIPIESFKALADLVPKEDPKPVPNNRNIRGYGNSQPFDLVTWINQHGIVYREKKSGGSTLFELEYCPWVDSHSDRKKWDSALFQDADGKITFNCTHSHCHGRTWFDFRTFYEPDAYAPKPQQYQPRQQYYLPQAIQPVILPETAEKGKKWFGMKDIKKVNINELPHFLTGFKELDNAIKGLFFCEVTILSGSNSSGKSSWLNTLILNTVQQGVKVALWSGELRPDVLKTWIQMVIAGKQHLKQSQYGNFWFVPNDIATQIDAWLEGRFFLYNNKYSNKWEQIFSDMKELLALGVRVFVLDNLMSMDIDIFEGDTNKKQKTLVQELCQFAKDNKVHIILVAHPRKSNAFLRKNDISGSANITDAVDNVFIIHRVNADFLRLGKEVYGTMINAYKDYGNVIEVCKNRMMGAQDFLVGMFYEQESRRFKNEVNEAIEYGWSGANQPDLFAEMPTTVQQQMPDEGLPFAPTDNNSVTPF